MNGIILGMERRNFLVDLGKTEAILPIQEQIPRETYRRGDRVKALLLEVRRPVIRDAADVAELLELPVLSTVSAFVAPGGASPSRPRFALPALRLGRG